MKYWEQFAEMLGLELEQEFNLTDADGKKINYASYKITENGLCFKATTNGAWHSETSIFLKNLLSGDYKAVPKPWKPKNGDAYWKWATYLELAQFKHWNGSSADFACWKLGNCFKTSEEAQSKGKEIMEQIKEEYEEA
jgi:hypothetical protein